jgi:hypothetical protein
VTSPTVISGLVNGLRYYVSVRAYNEIGWGDPSVVEGATPAIPPTMPLNFTTTFTSSNDSLLITWSPPQSDGGTALTGYALYWTASNGLVGTSFVDPDMSSFTIHDVAFGTRYTISIVAQNGVGSSANLTTFIAIPASPPPSPFWSFYLVPLAFVGILLCTFLILMATDRHRRSRRS